MSDERYFVQDDPPAGVALETDQPDKVLDVLRKVYPDLREVTREEYDAAEAQDERRWLRGDYDRDH